jgi:hypothetical protein
MVEKTTEAGRFSWRLPVCASIVGLLVFIAIDICKVDTSFFLSAFVITPVLVIVSVVLLIYAAVRSRRLREIVATVAILWAIAGLLDFYDRKHPEEIRETARWLVWSHEYKQVVLAQSTSANGDLKHIEWDAWGYAGAGNTTVYLVFDPSETLWTAAKSHQLPKFNGVPCDVFAIRRLESRWYAVHFYTDQDWDHCKQ